MTELKIRAEVVGSEEAKSAKDYYAKACKYRCYFFRADEGEATAIFNYGKDVVVLDHSFLGNYARSNITEGDPLAKVWEVWGFQKLGERVSWRLSPHALVFALVSGHEYQLRRAALRAWMDQDDGWEFPRLERV